MEKIKISTEYITLGQFLKFSGIISNGGEAKPFLQNCVILVNNEPENRRGKKLRPGDFVEIEAKKYQVIGENES